MRNCIKTPGKRGQTLAQILNSLWIILIAMNNHNKKHCEDKVLSDEIIDNFKKEIHKLSTDNQYMKKHISLNINVLNNILNSQTKTVIWFEDYIRGIIHMKGKTKFLTTPQWNELLRKVYRTDVQIVPPLKKLKYKIK